MTVSAKAFGIDQLDVSDKLDLVEQIWASIAADPSAFPLSASQRAELDRRIADDDAFPGDVVPWNEVRAAVEQRVVALRSR